MRTEQVIIKTFGESFDSHVKELDVVQFKIKHKNDSFYTFVEAFCVPIICSPLKGQCINKAKVYEELKNLEFADANDLQEDLPIGILIGLDSYYKFFSGKHKQSQAGLVASHTVLGWVISGVISSTGDDEVNATMFTTSMRVSMETQCEMTAETDNLRKDLARFWNVEEIGSDNCVISKFEKDISFDGTRYVTKLPFKEDHDCLPDNFDVAKQRLSSLKTRLVKQDILKEYDTILKEYEEAGIIARVPLEQLCKEIGQVHYIPHRPVVREDKDSTKIRAVFDASCKVNGPSLNECLYPGPNLLLKIFDVLLRFRFNRIVMIADIKQAFLNVGISEERRDFLRFLWFDIGQENKLILFRFCRAVFGVTSSPFLLNATIKHHLSKSKSSNLGCIVEKIVDDLYLDDLISGCESVEEGKFYYENAKILMTNAGFDLRKWISNDAELSEYLRSKESSVDDYKESNGDDVTYFDAASGRVDENTTVLGIRWDRQSDQVIFDFITLLTKCHTMKNTKRELLSVAATVFDPLGMVAPVTARIKIIFQLLCKDNLSWDEKIPQNILLVWNSFISELSAMKEIRIPRYVLPFEKCDHFELHGFCDSSKEAYCAVLYLRSVINDTVTMHFLASKTKVAPLKELSIPRLELLGCLLLSNLLRDVTNALRKRVVVKNVVCWSDSRVSLAWIRGKERSWKPWVENRVVEIRKVVGREKWNYVKSECNPADIPTRSAKSLNECFDSLWFNGPSFLLDNSYIDPSLPVGIPSPSGDILKEAKKSFLGGDDVTTNMTITDSDKKSVNTCLSEIVDIHRFSCLDKLVNVTAYVFRFINNLKRSLLNKRQEKNDIISVDEYREAL